eukprot:COSAG02_NODE_52226_length_309_cov_0.733333_1_plen_96_part_10
MLKHSAATAIQAVQRGVQARQRYKHQLDAAHVIQRIWRGYNCRELLKYLHSSAVVLQSVARVWRARLEYTAALAHIRQVQMRAAAIRMQAIQRGRQ